MTRHRFGQVCVNGHVVPNSGCDSPICDLCGVPTFISACQHCGAEITAEARAPEAVPTHCSRCNKPFPWTISPWDGKRMVWCGDLYVEPRVMRHSQVEQVHYAIHEVYFEDGNVYGYTEDALSPKARTLAELRAILLRLLAGAEDEITSGDLGYVYDREYVEEWLDCLQSPPIDAPSR